MNVTALADALPAILLEGGASGPALRAVAAWYAPQSDYALTAQYVKPPAEMAITTSLLLVLTDRGQEVLGGLTLLPFVEKRFSFDVSVPAGWQVAAFQHRHRRAAPGKRGTRRGPRRPRRHSPV